MKKIFCLLSTLVFLLNGCVKKETIESVIDPVTKTLESQFLLLKNSKDRININSTRVGSSDISYYTSASLPNLKPIDSYSIGSVNVALKNNGLSLKYVPELAQYFGKKTPVSINFADKSAVSERTQMELEILPPVEIIEGGGGGGGGSFTRGQSLQWVAGNPNDDIYIAIAFSNTSIFNEEFLNSPEVYRYKAVKDNGATNLTNADFAGIPNGAFVEIYVIRGRVVIAGGSSNGSGAGTVVSSISSALVGGILN